jgi:WD40 repeat protein
MFCPSAPITAGFRFKDGQVKLWELPDVTVQRRVNLPPPTSRRVHYTARVVFSPTDRLIAAPDSEGIYMYAFGASESVPLALLPAGRSAVFSPDGNALYTGGSDGAQRWPMKWSTGHSELHLGPPEILEPTRGLPVSWVEMSRDGQWLVAQANHTVLTFRTAPPFEAIRFTKALRLGVEPHICSDGRWVATITPRYDHIQIFDGRSGEVLTNLPTKRAWNCAFSPDSRWLAAMQLDSMTVWNTSDWSVHRRVPHPPEDFAHGLEFNPDGRILATFASDWKVRLVNFETGEELGQPPAGRLTTSVRFNATSDRLAVANESGYYQLWDLRRVREQLASLHLDWNLPPYPPSPSVAAPRPFRMIVYTAASDKAVQNEAE